MMRDVWIVDAVRTPRGVGKPNKGALSGIHPQRLLAAVFGALSARQDFDTAALDDVIAGCGSQWGQQAQCIARMAALDAGYSPVAPGVTIDRFCGSGLTAVNLAMMGIASGMQELVVAGGVESMSYLMTTGLPATLDSGNLHLRARVPQPHQGICADLIATLEGIGRTGVDSFAAESQRRASVAIAEGRFDGSLIAVHADDGRVALERDEYPRPATTAESLAKLQPAFPGLYDLAFDETGDSFRTLVERRYPDVVIEHIHHAGNSSGIVDGAAALLLASSDHARDHGLRPRARIRAVASIGDDPTLMLNAPVPAVHKALAKAGLAVSDIDLWEINEAFAVVPLKFMRDLGLDPSTVNVNGGAIALGHPIGATGAILLGTLIDELERQDKTLGVVSLCAAGGMAPAIVVERI